MYMCVYVDTDIDIDIDIDPAQLDANGLRAAGEDGPYV